MGNKIFEQNFLPLMRKILILIIIILSFQSCYDKSERYIPTIPKSKLPDVNIHIKRYGKAIFTLDTNNLRQELTAIKNQYLLFLDTDLSDSNAINKLKNFITDTLNRSLYKKSEEVFPNLNAVEQQLSSAYSHLKYYFPGYKTQSFYSYISGVYYEQPVMLYDTFALIGLDNYLGNDCQYYNSFMIPKYKSKWMIPQEIVPDVMREIFYGLPQKRYKPTTLLDQMIFAGKLLFFMDAVMPDIADTLKIRYSGTQLNWVKNNEKNIWAFLISNKLLFSADFKQTNKLMQDGPFTNGFSHDAPSRLGEYIGWQIVSNFMKNNSDVSLQQLLKITDSQKILTQSKYKP